MKDFLWGLLIAVAVFAVFLIWTRNEDARVLDALSKCREQVNAYD
jgi:protein-S-isoprenylcysteine O-methyltransferase Ste14